jgi:hypothetical protein
MDDILNLLEKFPEINKINEKIDRRASLKTLNPTRKEEIKNE